MTTCRYCGGELAEKSVRHRTTAEMKIWYDREGDYLEIVFEDAAASLEEVEEDMFAQRPPGGLLAYPDFTSVMANAPTPHPVVSLPSRVSGGSGRGGQG